MKSNRYKWLPALILAFLVIGDNYTSADWIKKFNKSESQQRVAELKIQLDDSKISEYTAAAFIKTGITGEEPFIYHIDGMLACQDAGIPCINAYTGYFPDDYFSFYYVPDRFNLEGWCLSRQVNPDKILLLGKHEDIKENKVSVKISTEDLRFFRMNTDSEITLFANASLDSATTFSIIFLKEGKCVIRSANKKYLSAELGRNSELTSNRTYVREWETFRIDTLENGLYAIKAYNDKYVTIGEPDFMVKAVSDNPVPLKFTHAE
jgi:hypothetical protein